MKTIQILFTILFFCFTAGSCEAQGENKLSPSGKFSPWFFIQLTDPQFGFINPDSGFSKETELYEKAVVEINRLKPDFVVITGDFVNNTTDPKQIAEFKRITSKIAAKIPVYYTPGNHDVGNVPDSALIAAYNKNYGYQWFSFKHKGTLFAGFNSSFIKNNTPGYEEQQFNWLKTILQEKGDVRHTILFCHFPFFIKSFDEAETYSNIGMINRQKYLSLFEASNVEYIFSGHLHNNASGQFGNVHLVTTSALGKQLGKAMSGFRIVKVYDDRIEHQYYSLDQVPEKITF